MSIKIFHCNFVHVGHTLGAPEDGYWNTVMKGGTRLFRENIIAVMREEVVKEINESKT